VTALTVAVIVAAGIRAVWLSWRDADKTYDPKRFNE
jgi:hypothetical protein